MEIGIKGFSTLNITSLFDEILDERFRKKSPFEFFLFVFVLVKEM